MLNKIYKRFISLMAAAIMAFTDIVPVMPVIALPEESSDLTMQSIELYPDGEDGEKSVTLEGMMPEGAEAEAVDVSDEHDGIAAYDITITDGSDEYQPDEHHPIKVEITDPAITDSEGLELWHIKDDGTREQITDFTASDGTITFMATGFSVYEIVQMDFPTIVVAEPGWNKVDSVNVLTSAKYKDDGFYISGAQDLNGYFAKNRSISGIKAAPKRYGIDVTGQIKDNNNRLPSAAGANYAQIIENAQQASAARYYFEETSENSGKYYIYCYGDDDEPYYAFATKADSVNSVKLVSGKENASEWTIEITNGNASFYDEVTGLYWNNSSGNKSGFAGWTGTNNFNIWYYYVPEEIPYDPYDLEGTEYGLMNYYTGTSGNAVKATAKNSTSLSSETMVVRTNTVNHQTKLYVSLNSDISMWTFHSAGGDCYKIESDGQYLKLTSGGVSLTTESDATPIKVIPGTGAQAGKIRLTADGYDIDYSSSSFRSTAAGNGNTHWLSLVEKSNIQEEDFIVYSANKVGVGERESGAEDAPYVVKNEDQVIVYTRIWDEASKTYNFYAIDHDGSLVQCYERGDNIMWVGSKINTLLWDFTEYYYDGTTTPNNYYELYNSYSGKYLAPQDPDAGGVGQVLSDSTIGINLDGRRDNEYFSKIMAWDDPHYSFAAIKADLTAGKIVSCTRNEAVGENTDFYFAIMEKPEPAALTVVETIDNNEYGISMKMVDFADLGVGEGGKNVAQAIVNAAADESGATGTYTVNNWGTATRSSFTWDYLGGSYTDQQGLLSTDLGADGYPTVAAENFSNLKDNAVLGNPAYGKSIKGAFSAATPVNHLFIKSTYEATGYFEFDSCQNTATLIQPNGSVGNEFTVYKELATDNINSNSHKHGQFFPYNTIVPGVYSSNNEYNKYNALLQELDASDPRKGEQLYLLQFSGTQPNCYNGMELQAGFIQTPDGQDAWKHDIIFEFTGDDDFWLYVDNELIIDLGGIHSAYKGTVNFHTGEVKIQKGKDAVVETKTLRQLFYDNYISRGHTAAEALAYVNDIFELKNVDGNNCYVFTDYSSHKMKIFYMERGASASNLHMRFNLSYVTPGSVMMSKQITDEEGDTISDIDYSSIKYPYQIYYCREGEEDTPLENYTLLEKDASSHVGVYYLNPKREAEYYAHYKAPGVSTPYHNVFFLTPGKDVSIDFPENTYRYYIRECGINSEVYDTVRCNGQDNSLTQTAEGTYQNFVTVPALVTDRPTMALQNRVDTTKLKTLTFTKQLYDKDNNPIFDDKTTFCFRLYLADEGSFLTDENGEIIYVDDDGNRVYDGTGTPIHDEELKLAYMHSYYVVSPDGYLCSWDSANDRFVETEYTNYSTLTEAQKKTVTFETSINGTISKIPAWYSVKVPNLMTGTKFEVEERVWDNPIGYSLKENGYVCVQEGEGASAENTYDIDLGDPVNIGRVNSLHSPKMEIKNERGYGLEANKVWSDADYTKSHQETYIAVYIRSGDSYSLVADTVRQISDDNTSFRFYFPSLQSGKTISDYVIREVKLTGDYTVANDGTVTGYTASQVKLVDNNGIDLLATAKDDTEQTFKYNVDYTEGSPTGETDNARKDTVTNIRQGGIAIRLYKWGTDVPLQNGIFTLKKDGAHVGKTSYASDANGLVTVLYTPSQDGEYELTETQSPKSYVGMPETITFKVNNSGVYDFTNPNDPGWAVLVSDDPSGKYLSIIDIYNKPYELRVIKTDGSGEPLEGAHFEIYKGVKDQSGNVIKDYTPVSWDDGSELITGADGIIPHIDKNLIPLSYYLTETRAPKNYEKLENDIQFTIDKMGEISCDSKYMKRTESMIENTSTLLVTYTISIPNTSASSDYYFDIEKLILIDKNIHNSDPTQKFVFKVERYAEDDTVMNTLLESFYVTMNCTNDPENGIYPYELDDSDKYSYDSENNKVTVTYKNGEKYTFPAAVKRGVQTVKVKKKGIYKVTELSSWSSTDYDFWYGSNRYLGEDGTGSADTEGKYVKVIVGEGNAAYAPSSEEDNRPTASFTNTETEFAYLSAQAYAENTIKHIPSGT